MLAATACDIIWRYYRERVFLVTQSETLYIRDYKMLCNGLNIRITDDTKEECLTNNENKAVNETWLKMPAKYILLF